VYKRILYQNAQYAQKRLQCLAQIASIISVAKLFHPCVLHFCLPQHFHIHRFLRQVNPKSNNL
jgi:hypothetical protein